MFGQISIPFPLYQGPLCIAQLSASAVIECTVAHVHSQGHLHWQHILILQLPHPATQSIHQWNVSSVSSLDRIWPPESFMTEIQYFSIMPSTRFKNQLFWISSDLRPQHKMNEPKQGFCIHINCICISYVQYLFIDCIVMYLLKKFNWYIVCIPSKNLYLSPYFQLDSQPNSLLLYCNKEQIALPLLTWWVPWMHLEYLSSVWILDSRASNVSLFRCLQPFWPHSSVIQLYDVIETSFR